MVIYWIFNLFSLSLVLLFHLILVGNPKSIPLQRTHLRNSAFLLKAVAISHLSCQLYTNPRFVLLWSTAPMSGVVLLHLLSIFSTMSSLKLPGSSTIQTSPIPYSLSPTVVFFQIFPFSTVIFTDTVLWKSRILFD